MSSTRSEGRPRARRWILIGATALVGALVFSVPTLTGQGSASADVPSAPWLDAAKPMSARVNAPAQFDDVG
jgi:hypothetical protein